MRTRSFLTERYMIALTCPVFSREFRRHNLISGGMTMQVNKLLLTYTMWTLTLTRIIFVEYVILTG